MKKIQDLEIDGTWTLFLGRDGIVNKQSSGIQVKDWTDFEFTYKALDAIQTLSTLFQHIIIITNQEGIGEELMSHEQLHALHEKMLSEIVRQGGYIDNVYYAPELEIEPYNTRKPSPIMALQAKEDFPNIDFKKSIMVGNSIADIEFAINTGMQPIFITTNPEDIQSLNEDIGFSHFKQSILADYPSLYRFSEDIITSL